MSRLDLADNVADIRDSVMKVSNRLAWARDASHLDSSLIAKLDQMSALATEIADALIDSDEEVSKAARAAERVQRAQRAAADAAAARADGWKMCAEELPADGLLVEVRTSSDGDIHELRRRGSLWFLPGYEMYVYLTPMQWRAKQI